MIISIEAIGNQVWILFSCGSHLRLQNSIFKKSTRNARVKWLSCLQSTVVVLKRDQLLPLVACLALKRHRKQLLNSFVFLLASVSSCLLCLHDGLECGWKSTTAWVLFITDFPVVNATIHVCNCETGAGVMSSPVSRLSFVLAERCSRSPAPLLLALRSYQLSP